MSLNPLVEYTPAPRARLHLSPLDALKLRQLPQLVRLGALEAGVLPVDVECIEACSPVNGLCTRIGDGSTCIRGYTPLVPGTPPGWALKPVEPLVPEGRRPLGEASTPGRLVEERVFDGVYRPRFYYLEPLGVRIVRVEEGEVQATLGCLDWPGGGVAVEAVGDEPPLIVVKPGRVVVEGDARLYTVKRCGRGVFASLVNQGVRGRRAPFTVLTGAAILSLRYAEEGWLEVTLWNPHLHPVEYEVYSDYPVVRATLVDAEGEEELPVYRRSLIRGVVRGEWVVVLRVEARRRPGLLA